MSIIIPEIDEIVKFYKPEVIEKIARGNRFRGEGIQVWRNRVFELNDSGIIFQPKCNPERDVRNTEGYKP